MGYWCWEREDWGKWQTEHLKASDSYIAAQRSISNVKAISSLISDENHVASEARLLEEESIKTSLIEGKVLDRASVRASIAKKLGINSVSSLETRNVDGLVETLTDATKNHHQLLTNERLHRWQASLFPTGRDERGYPLEVGQYRTSILPMKVVTIQGPKETLHYFAPSSELVENEMNTFIDWFNKTSDTPNFIRAAIASYWFVSIHPFEDGNGRLSRAIADMAIAQSENSPYRLYSMSETLKSSAKYANGYYENLEACQRGEKSIDAWVLFFLDALSESARKAEALLGDILTKTAFWDSCRNIPMNDRQSKFINWAIDKGNEFAGHIKRQRYKKIVGGISDATAKRDLLDLVSKEVLVPIATTGRNAGYQINNVSPARLKMKN